MFICFGMTLHLLAAQSPSSIQSGFTEAEADSIKVFLEQNFGNTNAGLVVGLVDERRTRIISAGKLDNGTAQEVNGDTLFEIGSVTKTFTALLLVDMVQRGEMKLDDPVAKYLPKSVKVPSRNGRQITLLDLATHTAGLPRDPSNLTPRHSLPENAFADYSVEKLYAFLSSFALDGDPGSKFEYSNVGMALLGHILALKAGTNYEALVVERICRPLKMNSTRITLPPQTGGAFGAGPCPTRKTRGELGVSSL
jgi:CubicO group peptidase (beta-lactamase class C family)